MFVMTDSFLEETDQMKTFFRVLGGPVIIGLMMMVSFASPVSARPISPNPLLLPKSPYSTSVLVAQGIHNGTIHLSGHGSGQGATPNLNCTPAPCVFTNKRVSPGTQPVNETPIAADPLTHSHLLTGGNDYNCANLQGFYSSSTGGSSFTSTCMNNLPGQFGEGDPGVGYDTLHSAYITGIEAGTPDGSDIIFEKSSNNGGTWSAPAAAVKPFFTGGLTDKDWLQIDDTIGSPHVNCLYISVTQFASNNNSTITVSHSCNGGTTWTTVQVDTTQVFPAIDQFSDLAIDKNGNVFASWMRCTANGPTGDCGGTTATLVVSESTNGGASFGTIHTIAKANLTPDSCGAFYGCLPNTNERVSNIPSIDSDRSSGVHSGNLYAAFYNWTGSQMQVKVATSTNSGTTWGAPVRVTTAGGDEFFPWLTVSKTGIVGATWNDRRNGSGLSYEEFGALSNTGGASFGTNFQLASALSNPNNDGFGGGFMGDYSGNIWAGKKLYAVWTDTRSGPPASEWMGGIKNNA